MKQKKQSRLMPTDILALHFLRKIIELQIVLHLFFYFLVFLNIPEPTTELAPTQLAEANGHVQNPWVVTMTVDHKPVKRCPYFSSEKTENDNTKPVCEHLAHWRLYVRGETYSLMDGGVHDVQQMIRKESRMIRGHEANADVPQQKIPIILRIDKNHPSFVMKRINGLIPEEAAFISIVRFRNHILYPELQDANEKEN